MEKSKFQSFIVACPFVLKSSQNASYWLFFFWLEALLWGPSSLPNLIFFLSVIWTVLCRSWGSRPSTSVMPCGPGVGEKRCGGVVPVVRSWRCMKDGSILSLCCWLLTGESPCGNPWPDLSIPLIAGSLWQVVLAEQLYFANMMQIDSGA